MLSDYVTCASEVAIITIDNRLILYYFLNIIDISDTVAWALLIAEAYLFRGFIYVLDFLLVYDFSLFGADARVKVIGINIRDMKGAGRGVQFLYQAPLLQSANSLLVDWSRLLVVLIYLLWDGSDLFGIISLHLTKYWALVLEIWPNLAPPSEERASQGSKITRG